MKQFLVDEWRVDQKNFGGERRAGGAIFTIKFYRHEREEGRVPKEDERCGECYLEYLVDAR